MTLKKPFTVETTFTTYKAIAIIGEGGSGRIYEVVDDDRNKYAMKLLNAATATKEKQKRFKNELDFCSKNKHPHIITVIDHGVLIEGKHRSPFYIMTRYDGSLRNLITSGIPTDRVLQYFSQILNGIEAAHMMKVIHRDLKPENILYDSFKDHLVIADFGIAHFEEDDLFTAVDTKDSERLANFLYAAPEQRSRSLLVDHRADIYALGLILNEMFTGVIPHGTGYKTIGSINSQYEYLDDITFEMLRQEPKERSSTIEIIKNQLIARKNDFISRQRISDLKQTVVPTKEIDDPIIADPIRLVNFDWEPNKLTLTINQPVNEKWLYALNHMGSFAAIMGKGPESFKFNGSSVTIPARESEVQPIINHFKEWLLKTNAVYKNNLEHERQKEEENHRKELENKLATEEARQRVLKNTKI